MKSRSHRLPPTDPPDDWVDGSWTVDCSCGVTFDDGEEMVSCDECGVWVHTRCSRFVKGEASFACHNCKKNTNNHNSSSINFSKKPASIAAVAADTEETEVAQLLIELPTKADSCPPPNPFPAQPYRPPFRLWAEVPLEDKVHVQGVPGGDPALFQGISSSVFTSELWRCTGYVPKKFNFQYREFSCWDEDGGENTASRGADMLFSLSKEIVPCCAPAKAFERKQEGEKVLFGGRLQSWGKKERNKLRVFGSHSSKRRKEELREGKDRSGKKKARSDAQRVAAEFKKRGSVPVAELNKAELCEDGVPQVAESDVLSLKREDGVSMPNSGDRPEGTDTDSKQKELIADNSSKGGLPDEEPRAKSSSEVRVKVEIDDGTAVISSKIDAIAGLNDEKVDARKKPAKEEDVCEAINGLERPNKESPVVVSENSRAVIDKLNVPNSKPPDANGSISVCSKMDNLHVGAEEGDARDAEGAKLLSCSASDGNLQNTNDSANLQQRAAQNTSEIFEEHETVMGLPFEEQKFKGGGKEEILSSHGHDKATEESSVRETKQHGQAVEESAALEIPVELVLDPGISGETLKIADVNLSQVTPVVHIPMAAVEKDSSALATQVVSRPPVPSSFKSGNNAASSSSGKTIHLSKQQRLKVSSSSTTKKDNSSLSTAEESMRQVSRQSGKSHPKSLDHPGSKSSQTIRNSHASVPKHGLSGSKEQLLGPSSKASSTANAVVSGSAETIQPRSHNASAKLVASGPSQKNEKLNQPIPNPPSKLLNHTVAIRPPGSVASTLSDEELALLLHQELNSSPRVPRVPRMRQATGAQLASQTGPSMLSKRSSHSGGKDQGLRRKNKDETSRDGSRNSHDSADETKRHGRAMVSPDSKYRESASTADGSAQKESRTRSPDNAASVRKTIASASTEGENNCQPSSEASGQNAMPVRSSPRDGPDVDSNLTRTLPGLVDEILSKRKCSTYEELCDAVRPYWYSLRKPNGERYAYSSHSHAVLDCLRNRSEWAHLIDRGPKTNSSKRRRKLDSDLPAVEESENEVAKDNTSRGAEERDGDSHREDFPKGKRKARKRRQLESQGRALGEARKRKRSASQGSSVVSDDDDNNDDDGDHSINDAADGFLSEDESQGAVDRASGSETSSSASSDDSD